MTLYKGTLLFDIVEDSINGWENQLGYRGMLEVWRKNEWELRIEPDDDSDEWEVWINNGDGGYYDSLSFGVFKEMDRFAKDYMAKH